MIHELTGIPQFPEWKKLERKFNPNCGSVYKGIVLTGAMDQGGNMVTTSTRKCGRPAVGTQVDEEAVRNYLVRGT